MEFRYLGQSCFDAAIGGRRVLFDPFIRGNELAMNAGIKIDEIKADYILVSHGHSDHSDDLLYIAERNKSKVVSTFEIYSWLNKNQIANVHPMNIGGKWKFDFGTVKMTHAVHSSSMGDGTYAGTAAGFLIFAEEKIIYYSGDTALTYDMKLIGEMYQVDAAFLPIGDNFTMDAADACKAAEFIGCNKIIAMHYDTFGFIKVDHAEVKKIFKKEGKEIHFLGIGKSIKI
ncbi:MAG: metal-dependent hydrolase [Bacteroidia bacterium]